jgi:hypothetical protein
MLLGKFFQVSDRGVKEEISHKSTEELIPKRSLAVGKSSIVKQLFGTGRKKRARKVPIFNQKSRVNFEAEKKKITTEGRCSSVEARDMSQKNALFEHERW